MREKTETIRFQIYLTDRQLKTITEIGKNKGITKAELIRRIIDEWIDKKLS
jgi:hypothetical protein